MVAMDLTSQPFIYTIQDVDNEPKTGITHNTDRERRRGENIFHAVALLSNDRLRDSEYHIKIF